VAKDRGDSVARLGRNCLDSFAPLAHITAMANTVPGTEVDDDAAEAAALLAAVARSRADARGVPHEEMRAWLLKIVAGKFDATPPVPRLP
jgi:hypothetical protein